MNIILKGLETAFDLAFHSRYPNLQSENPLYIEVYKEELADFYNYLVNMWQDSKEIDKE